MISYYESITTITAALIIMVTIILLLLIHSITVLVSSFSIGMQQYWYIHLLFIAAELDLIFETISN